MDIHADTSLLFNARNCSLKRGWDTEGEKTTLSIDLELISLIRDQYPKRNLVL